MEPGSLMRLCFRRSSTLTSAIAPPRPSSPNFSVLNRNPDRRRLDGRGAIHRGFQSSTTQLQQQAAAQEQSEDDDFTPQFISRPSNIASPPTGTQTGRFPSPQPAPSGASATPRAPPGRFSASSDTSESQNQPQSQRERMLDFVAPPPSSSARSSQQSYTNARPQTQSSMNQSTTTTANPTKPSSPSSKTSPVGMMANFVTDRNFPTPTAAPGQTTTQKVASQISTNPSNHLALTGMTLRLKPSLGRTTVVDANRGTDVQRAILTTERKVKLNNVRLDERAQKFHVRAGQRRKILKSRRWRKLFKEGFQHEVSRIQRMRKQGW